MTSNRIKFVNYHGKQVFYVDFRGIEMEDVADVMAEAKEIIARQPFKSVRHLTDVTDTNFSKRTIQQFKEYANHNTPYIYRSAAIGVTGIMVVLFNAVVKFSGRKNLMLKNSLEEAKAWLCDEK